MKFIEKDTVWWRQEPLTENEACLLTATLAAHAKSADRGNVSGQALRLAWAGSGSYTQALIGALSTLGGMHAPLVRSYTFLIREVEDVVRFRLDAGLTIPGWGNSFHKGKPDPLWTEVDELLTLWPELEKRIDTVTFMLHERGKKIFPNPSAYTAATAIALDMPPHLSPWLFIAGRLDRWTQMLVT